MIQISTPVSKPDFIEPSFVKIGERIDHPEYGFSTQGVLIDYSKFETNITEIDTDENELGIYETLNNK